MLRPKMGDIDVEAQSESELERLLEQEIAAREHRCGASKPPLTMIGGKRMGIAPWRCSCPIRYWTAKVAASIEKLLEKLSKHRSANASSDQTGMSVAGSLASETLLA
jgi:hypothetical protein